MRFDIDLNHIDLLTAENEIAAVIARIAGMPPSAHPALIQELAERSGRSTASLRAQLSGELRTRSNTKYSRLRLRSLLESIGVPGRYEGDVLLVSDPLSPGEEIIVRDAVLLGYEPIVEKPCGYSHRTDDYVVALVRDTDLKPFMISNSEVKRMAAVLNDCDRVQYIPPRLLSSPNLAAFEEVFKPGEQDRLLATLRMNQRYALVENAGQIVIFDNLSRDAFKREEFTAKLATETDIIRSGTDAERIPRFKLWFTHPARAYFKGVTFAPLGRDGHGRTRDMDYVFNLWTGYTQLGAPGDWSLLKQHIKMILCGGDEDAYEYLLNWLAHLYQRPWDKPGVAVVVWGKKRTGKGTVADAIRESLGPNVSRMFTQKEHVIGKFSSSAQPLMFNQCEEAVFAKDPREEGPLKSKITDPHENIELKFKTPYEVPSFGRWWFNSNSPTPVPITHDEERYFVLHISAERANDHAYFADIRRQLYHEGGLAAMVHELMARDISSFNVRKPPRSQHRAAMVLEMLSHADRAVADILASGEVALLNTSTGKYDIQTPLNRSGHTWVEKSYVCAVLDDVCRKYGAKRASTSDVTSVLKELGVIDRERNAHKKRGYGAGYRFLPLKEARAAFAAARGLNEASLWNAVEQSSVEDEFEEIVAWAERLMAAVDLGADKPRNYAAIEVAALALRAALHGSAKQPQPAGEDGGHVSALH